MENSISVETGEKQLLENTLAPSPWNWVENATSWKTGLPLLANCGEHKFLTTLNWKLQLFDRIFWLGPSTKWGKHKFLKTKSQLLFYDMEADNFILKGCLEKWNSVNLTLSTMLTYWHIFKTVTFLIFLTYWVSTYKICFSRTFLKLSTENRNN